jgi:hypothetical protein
MHLASWESPILALGTATISFPDGSSHSRHPIEVKPLGVGRRAESFVKDSVTYVWEMERFKTELKSLVKVVGEERKEVARYAQRAGRDREGMLVIDEGEVDGLVVVLSCVAVLEQRDSFSR